MGITDALDVLYQRGFFGEPEEGKGFFEAFKVNFSLVGALPGDPEQVQIAWENVRKAEEVYLDCTRKGLPTDDAYENLIEAKKQFGLLKKISS